MTLILVLRPKVTLMLDTRALPHPRLHFYVDVTPLFDHEWTGIPVVTAEFAKRFLTHFSSQTTFFFEDHAVNTAAVQDALDRRSGLYLRRDFFHGEVNEGPLPLGLTDRVHIGFFPSVKRRRGLFDHEFSVVHDLSTLLTPQFHIKENIDYHGASLLPDIETNRVTFCISSATHDDLMAYLGAAPERLKIISNGVFWPADFEIRYESEVGSTPVEKYALVLGTREPRKNLKLLFQALDAHRDLLDDIKLVVTGRGGWLEENSDVPSFVKEAISTGRIHITGFVSEYTKYKLLKAAEFLIFPSLFEGFGLPVAEAISVGTPSLSSLSSSLPEVGGDACYYFDPLSVESLAEGMRTMITDSLQLRAHLKTNTERDRQRLSWDNTFRTVLETITASVDAG
ncbi:glycosyltransferase family 1 protein [Microvirga sp. VF16]|uniref:glycosyltransferase family 4 protein n=1 Tax=Microvirga sp. VF16 TaxID=2807101 RepID=UPI00193E7B09|nr:glycosyltransferase family 1 protein [Microvirga sp. VF16]QRM35619.1 glycosyltransferase family 4 protein [Microvirga sp. VF16]